MFFMLAELRHWITNAPAMSGTAGRILVAEDEPGIASFLERGLRANGFATTLIDDGREALDLADSGEFDLLVLDVGLPGRDGLSVLQELRARGRRLPIVLLTGRNGVRDTVAGLEQGADDYVRKPFHFEELLARIRARLRSRQADEPTVLRVGTAALDLTHRRATVEGRTVELSAREFALAEVFFRHPGQVLSRQQLFEHAWGHGDDAGSNLVEVYVSHLRHKLGDAIIKTIHGLGYRLET
jgi:DNA-binding response OmpR family regulator